MGLKTIAASIALSALSAGAVAAVPTCTSTSSFGNLGPPGFELFGNSFTQADTYTDCYTFTLSETANSFGGTLEIDPLFNKLDIDVTSVSLYFGNSVWTDDTPLTFTFGDLAATQGNTTYTLAITSEVTNDPGWRDKPVGYAGAITTFAAPVPEPGVLALLAAGLLGVGVATRRRIDR